jgi:lysophospholipase L1-like esterase
MRMHRWFFLLIMLMLVLSSAQPASAAVTYPNSITALGDSITTAYDSLALGNNFGNSWSTGTNLLVNSIYMRIFVVNPAIQGKAANLAVSGTKMVDLKGQASQVGRKAEYVTILMGANDVCTSSMSTMTSVATFRSQFDAAMQTLSKRAPKARVYVLSIPDIYNLWYILKDNSSARTAWSLFSICQSMLARPQSTLQTDVDRRAAVRQRNIDFNMQLQAVCAAYPQCSFDNNAVFNTAFVTSDVSTIDYFHPSVSGQAKLAGVAWNASTLAGP